MDSPVVIASGRPKPRPDRPVLADRPGVLAVLDVVRRGDATRQEIEIATGLGRSAVTERVRALERLGLVEKGEARVSSGGRTPRTIGLRADAGCILVASVERSALGVGLADLRGRLRFEHHEAVDPVRDPEVVTRRLLALFDWADEQQERPLWGVGLGMPASVASRLERGKGGGASALEAVHDRLLGRYRAPVFLRSTAQMAALGQAAQLGGGLRDELVYVELRREITASVVTGGRVQRGALGAAGLLGHLYAGESAVGRCRCGNVGCLETVAGADALLAAAAQAAQAHPCGHLARLGARGGGLDLPDIALAAQLGDGAAAAILAQAGRAIGTALAALANAVNPATIVLAGEVAETGEILLAATREALYRHAHPLVTRDLTIIRSVMSRSAELFGAALTVVGELMAPPFIGSWIDRGSPADHPEMLALLAELGSAP
jgi:predicted NBD/HSP70 family sugar kinase